MDIPFVGKECEVPIFSDVHNFRVGVFAGNLHTTTSAYVPCKKSILCGTGDKPIVPKEDAYDKMMEDINADAVRAETAANKAEEKLADMQERYYTPSVNEDGDLSWEANDEGMPELPTVNIKGVPGDKGDKGDAGISPTIKMDYVADGHKLTITDVNGTQVFTVYDGKKGDKGDNADNDELFVVRKTSSTTADKTYAEIETAIAEKRAVLMVDAGKTYSYVGTDSSGGLVFCRYYESTNSKYPGIWEDRKTLSRNNVLDSRTFTPAQTPNPNKLKFTGAVNAEYDGSTQVTVNIPEGGGSTDQVQADWNENDPNSKAYVQNRTHYSETEQADILSGATAIPIGGGQFGFVDPVANQPTAGNIYTVSFDSSAYELEASTFDMEGMSFVGMGNPVFIGGEDNGLPLFMMFVPPDMVEGFNGMTVMVITSGWESMSPISVSGTIEKVHKIDEKYLPVIGASYLVNGSALGSVRNLNAYLENEEYKMGEGAFALGGFARGTSSFSVGQSATADGFQSFAHGSIASGDSSFAANNSESRGTYSFAANAGTAGGDFSAAFGLGTEAKGQRSFATGSYTVAAGTNQHAQGRYNIEDTANKYAHIVGNGTPQNLSNAHTIDWDGNGWFAGTVEGTALILTSPDGSRWQITVDNTGALATAKL